MTGPSAAVATRSPAAEAIARAASAGFAVRTADLGAGSARFRVCADVDARARVIRVDAAVLEAAERRGGAALAARLLAAAVTHELTHAERPSASEAAVRARVAAELGFDPDALVRALLAPPPRAEGA